MFSKIATVDDWQISQVTESEHRFVGMFFASKPACVRFSDMFRPEIDDSRYLHADGTDHNSTKHKGEWSGYFATREEIEAVIHKKHGT